MTTSPERPKVGLVLSGGGARGAYEVGVLRYVRERLGVPSPFHVITGSSVGAVNASYLAATCDRPRVQVRLLARVWHEIRLDNVYRFGWDQFRTLPQVLFGRNLPRKTKAGSTLGGLVDSSFLKDLVRERIPWRAISRNLEHGHLHAFACSATELQTGTTTVFVQSRDGSVEPWRSSAGAMVVPTVIGPEHALASAAIPLLFPAVRIGEQVFVDGSLRQNTPISPAMHLGANRLLVIGLRSRNEDHPNWDGAEPGVVYPNAVFMFGKMLNALLLDKVEADLVRIQLVNELLEAGIAAYGPEFPRVLGQRMPSRKGRPYRKIGIVHIQPSQDLGMIAWEVIRETGLADYSGMMARWLRRFREPQDMRENDLASYVLFDREYVDRLMLLGYADAEAQHDALTALFEA